MCTVEPVPMFSAYLGRNAQLLVVGTSEQLNTAAERLCRNTVAVEVEHATNGIATVEQCCRTLYDLCTVYSELVYLQSVVVSPLLSFMLDTIFCYSQPIEAQSTDGRFGLPAAYGHCLHTGDTLQCLHQATGKVLPQVLLANLDG